jgi:hypothetical protein
MNQINNKGRMIRLRRCHPGAMGAVDIKVLSITMKTAATRKAISIFMSEARVALKGIYTKEKRKKNAKALRRNLQNKVLATVHLSIQGILLGIFFRKIMTMEGINRLKARGAIPHHLKKSRHIKPPAMPINGKPTHSMARVNANFSSLYHRAFSRSLSPMLFHHTAGRKDK